MNVLVTGAAGFLGSHLVDHLIAAGHDVIGVDDLSTGQSANLPNDHKHLTFMFGDVRIPIPPDSTFPKVDRIYHLACPASPIAYQKTPVKTIETSLLGTRNMLALATRMKARFLLTSTSEVYGDPKVSPQPESYWGNVNPIGVRSCYDEGKRAAESLCYAFRQQYGTDVRVVRIFNTYGPRLAAGDGRVVSNFITQALARTPLTVYGDGKQTRSLCYVSDMILGIGAAMETDRITDAPINLGNPNELTMLELAQRIIKLVGPPASTIVHEGLPADDPKRRCPNIARAKTIGWAPMVDLDEGLKRTIRYFRDLEMARKTFTGVKTLLDGGS